jgi:hypothetical protein
MLLAKIQISTKPPRIMKAYVNTLCFLMKLSCGDLDTSIFLLKISYTFYLMLSFHHSTMQVRVSGHGGWFLVRLSLHDPVLPLNIEVASLPFISQSLQLCKSTI